MNKRDFLKFTGMGAVLAPLSGMTMAASESIVSDVSSLVPITNDSTPIASNERAARISKAQSLMAEQGIAAILIEPGAAMDYFCGLQWWRSERLTALVIPQKGEVAVVTPFFEKPSVLESLQIGDDVHVWQEHESPFKLVADILKSRGITSGKLGIEHSVRYFVVSGLQDEASQMTLVPAEPITLGCRMYKSASELALMHKANEITLKAYEFVYSQLQVGMSQAEVKGLMNNAQQQLGGSRSWAMALFNDASAYPHGTKAKQVINEGSVVLMDSGCAVHGYQSDISRTFVVGAPSQQVVDVWSTVREGQNVAFRAAKVGATAGSVDDTVRAYYNSKGFGKDYALPGLSHRTGHGIGMEGHESVNFVRGETTLLKKGMCFSNEPGIYIPGEFGVRLEDCLYMTDTGPAYFTEPPESLQKPLGKLAARNF